MVGTAYLPGSSGDYLLVFNPVTIDVSRYAVSILPDGLDSFRPGTKRFINLAPFDIALRLGDIKTLLASRNYTDVALAAEDGALVEVLMFSLIEDSDPYRAFSGSLSHWNNQRTLYLITPREGALPDFRAVRK